MKQALSLFLCMVSLTMLVACQPAPTAQPTLIPVVTEVPTSSPPGQLTLITEDFPPLNYVENEVAQGPSVEIVQAIQAKLGLDNKIEVYPWARGYKMTGENVNTAIFSTSRTKEREDLFKWVGPIAVKKYTFYAKTGSGIKITSLEDAKAYRIGVQLEGVTELDLKTAGFTNLDPVSTQAENLEKLRLGRIDLWYADSGSVIAICKQAEVNIQELEPLFVVREGLMYIAFNKDTDEHIIKAWQAAFDELYREGSIKKIFEQNQLENFYPAIE
jgi:polar amino acid transport system substrate-binding protein